MPLTFFVTTAHICTTLVSFDHYEFLPPFVNLSSSPYCTNISSQYNGTHYNNNSPHDAQYNSVECNTLPLPGKSQHTHLSTVNVHNNRPIGSAHFVQPMWDNSTSTYHSPSLVHIVCNNSPASSTCIVPYTGRQYARTVPNVDIVSSSKWHTRHWATGGLAHFNYVLVTDSSLVMTCASDRQVYLYPKMVASEPSQFKMGLKPM